MPGMVPPSADMPAGGMERPKGVPNGHVPVWLHPSLASDVMNYFKDDGAVIPHAAKAPPNTQIKAETDPGPIEPPDLPGADGPNIPNIPPVRPPGPSVEIPRGGWSKDKRIPDNIPPGKDGWVFESGSVEIDPSEPDDESDTPSNSGLPVDSKSLDDEPDLFAGPTPPPDRIGRGPGRVGGRGPIVQIPRDRGNAGVNQGLTISPYTLGMIPQLPVSGGDIFIGNELASHTPGSDGTTLIDTNEGVSDQQLIDNQRRSLGLPTQAPRSATPNLPGTEGAPPGMTVVGHDSASGQPVYQDHNGNLFVNPGTGHIVDQGQRFSQDSGTGNFIADQTTKAFVAAGGYAGTPNDTRFTNDEGHNVFSGKVAGAIDENGLIRRATASGGGPQGLKPWVMPSQDEAARLDLSHNNAESVKRLNDWIAKHNPENISLLSAWNKSRQPVGQEGG